uniref:Putative secreted protein n=1 Tax=Anopheles darlingi TaxID=43151 RepID=A0A2M4DPU8_ANODA
MFIASVVVFFCVYCPQLYSRLIGRRTDTAVTPLLYLSFRKNTFFGFMMLYDSERGLGGIRRSAIVVVTYGALVKRLTHLRV